MAIDLKTILQRLDLGNAGSAVNGVEQPVTLGPKYAEAMLGEHKQQGLPTIPAMPATATQAATQETPQFSFTPDQLKEMNKAMDKNHTLDVTTPDQEKKVAVIAKNQDTTQQTQQVQQAQPAKQDWVQSLLGAIPGIAKGVTEFAGKPEGFKTFAALTADPYMKEALVNRGNKMEETQLAEQSKKKDTYAALAAKAIENGDMETGKALAELAGLKLPSTMKPKEKWSNYGTAPIMQDGQYYIPQVSAIPDENGQPKIRLAPLPKGVSFNSTEGSPVNLELNSGEKAVGTYDKATDVYKVGERVIPMKDVKATGISGSTVIKVEQPKDVKKLPSSVATDLADQKTAIEMVPDLFNKAMNIPGLTYTPVDIVKAMNPLDTGAKAYAQIIASTKQIIGKGLEGGVLRAEDEKKYAKIIPAMGDTKEVLEAKANQLTDMLVRKYNNTLESQGLAGYDVGRFTPAANNQVSLPGKEESGVKAVARSADGKKIKLSDNTWITREEAEKRGL